MRSKKKSPPSARVTAIGVLGLVLAGLGAASILMASHESSSRIAGLPAVQAPASQMAAAPTHMAAAPMPKKAPAARTPAKVTVTASAVSAALPITRPAETAAAPKASAGESASRTTVELAPVTITGCLERSDEMPMTFRLTETTGMDAPKSRSWKKGFLKKGAAPVEVVDAANRLHLSTHVGQRVSVTGLLMDREMTLRSLQRVAASCD